jgi:hypothetical protein
VLTLGLLGIPSVSAADSFTGKFAGTGYGTGVEGYNNGTYFNVFAGQIKWDVGVDELLTTFCVDLEKTLTSYQTFTVENPTALDPATLAKISFLVASTFSEVASNWVGAGLQLAIWNVIYDDDYTVSKPESGNSGFYVKNGTAADEANELLLGLRAASLKGLEAQALFLNVRATAGQDQVTKYSTPEPGTMLLLGAGALALAARRRMARRAN